MSKLDSDKTSEKFRKSYVGIIFRGKDRSITPYGLSSHQIIIRVVVALACKR